MDGAAAERMASLATRSRASRDGRGSARPSSPDPDAAIRAHPRSPATAGRSGPPRATLGTIGDDDRRALARHQERHRDRLGADGDAESIAQTCSTRPLTSKKSTSRAPPDQWSPRCRRSTPSPRCGVSPLTRETRADLEQPHVAPAVATVVRDGVDEAGQERRPQRVELGGQRVRDRQDIFEAEARRARRDILALRTQRARRSLEQVDRLRFDEPEGHGFGESRGGQDAAHQLIAPDARVGRRAPDAVSAGKVGGSLSKPVVPADLFDQIHLTQRSTRKVGTIDVPAVGGRRHVEPEPAQNALDLHIGHRRAEQARQPCAPQVETPRRRPAGERSR